jgi:hypothetical protein
MSRHLLSESCRVWYKKDTNPFMNIFIKELSIRVEFQFGLGYTHFPNLLCVILSYLIDLDVHLLHIHLIALKITY